jgi:hypothetical protein
MEDNRNQQEKRREEKRREETEMYKKNGTRGRRML